MALRLMAHIGLWSLDVAGVVWLLTALWFAARRKANLQGKVWHFFRTLLPEPWMLLALAILLLLLHFVVPASDWRPVTYREYVLQMVGAIVIVASAALMVWARFSLGDMWAGRPMVQEDHELRTSGPYRLVRHPIYTGIIGATLGLMLLAGFSYMILVVALVVAWLAWRVHVEDGMMLATFGDRYREYQRRVRAIVPLPRRVVRT